MIDLKRVRLVPFLRCITVLLFISNSVKAQESDKTKWAISDPIFMAGAEGAFDEVAVKDPSIVFYEGMWHLFYTARGNNEYTTGYASAKELLDLQSAQRHELEMIRGKSRYGCAPQVLYFEPQGKWYLVFQNRDSNYQPVFSTTSTISDPKSWSNPKSLIKKDNKKKWIDFWVICDKVNAYLFYTKAHSGVVVRSTILEDFPNGWSKEKNVFDGVHEAVHIYKVKGENEFHMIYELNNDGIRSFGLAKTNNLATKWIKETDFYATGNQLNYIGNNSKWTDMVSHGEVIRSGYNQLMEYEPDNCRWIIQGIPKKVLNAPYPSLPWKLGIIEKVEQNNETEK